MNLRSTIYRSAHIPAHTDRCAWPSSIHISSTSQSHIGNACHLADVNTHDRFRLHRARCLVALTTALPGLPLDTATFLINPLLTSCTFYEIAPNSFLTYSTWVFTTCLRLTVPITTTHHFRFPQIHS